jgi:hypothetical protein
MERANAGIIVKIINKSIVCELLLKLYLNMACKYAKNTSKKSGYWQKQAKKKTPEGVLLQVYKRKSLFYLGFTPQVGNIFLNGLLH